MPSPELHPSSRLNWAGNYRYYAPNLEAPRTLEELQQTVRKAAHCKALGTRHSFQGIADTAGTQISLEHFQKITLRPESSQVTIGSGVRYGDLSAWLAARGYALHNLASLPHISVAGACATATHGSGLKNGNLSTAVEAIRFVTADGTIAKLSRAADPELFPGAVVALGALGVVFELTLHIEPPFQIAQTVYENLPFAALKDHLLDIFGAAYSVCLFTEWQHGLATQAWVKRRIGADTLPAAHQDFYGAPAATRHHHPLAGHEHVHCTQQLGVSGPSHERLPHFRMEFTPSSGAEMQSEYFVPVESGYAAMHAIERLRDRITPHLFVSELRTIAADDLWMSPCYQRTSLAVHFTWKPHWEQVRQILPEIEAALLPLGARPHWGKLFTLPAQSFLPSYGRLGAFKNLCREYDAAGKFRNEFLDRTLFSD